VCSKRWKGEKIKKYKNVTITITNGTSLLQGHMCLKIINGKNKDKKKPLP
jgi:hypothetical protein